MPVPAMFVDPMLGTFRDFMRDIDAKNLTGADVDTMREALARMEHLAATNDDFATFSGLLMQEGLFLKFSDAYGRALAAAASASAASGGGPSDESLLAQSLKSYEDALATYERGDAGDDARALIPFVERILEIGRSGASYPVFLRMMEEEGLTRVLEGAAPVARAGLVKTLDFAKANWLPRSVEESAEILAIFDDMAAAAAFGQPDPFVFGLARTRVEWRFAPAHRLWSAIVDHRDRLIFLLVDWLDAHAAFAFYDARWRGPGMTDEQVRRNIRRTKECAPGDFRVLAAITAESFGLAWDDLWAHETFAADYAARRIAWTDERLRLVRATHAVCVPGAKAPDELVKVAEDLHARKADIRADGGRAIGWQWPPPAPPAFDG
ncbi:MAG: hypothetical protein KJ042_17865 [Deltaproteobacteria bacterium]|nr:hypothetical protein [Deltaproteobacteria bacterium]